MSLQKRKFGIEIVAKWPDQQIVNKINEDRVKAKSKRLEENYKLVFKKALKFLLSRYKKLNKLKCRKVELEKKFFNYYFSKICEETGNTMETFLFVMKDNEKVSQNLFNPKTINAKYVQTVTKSELFLGDFNVYLDKDFLIDYSKSREFKMNIHINYV